MARTRLTRNTVPRQVTDPFTLKFLPPENQLLKWKDDITRKNQHTNGTFVYAENAQGCFDISSLQTMLKLNSAKSIKNAVQKEIKWFAAPYDIPATIHQPPASSIEQFKDLLYSVRYDKVISPYGMSPNELSTICIDRWLSCDPITWLMKALNGSQSHTYCLYLNEFRRDPSSLKCFVNGSTKPDRFLFAVNVGRSSKGDTFIGSDLKRGCHWTMCLVDINSRDIIYGDSLGWPVPHGLIDKVYSFIRLACSAERDEFSVVLCHAPHSVNSRTGSHDCNSECAQLYPFQTCSSICGIVVMVMAAIACHNLPLFKLMSTTCQSQGDTNQLPHIYLQKPSQFNGYLRRVIASWVAENAVSMEYLVPQSVQLPLQSISTHNVKKDVNQSSDEDQDPCNEHPAMHIPSNDFPVCEDRCHKTPTTQVPDCINDQDKPDDEVSTELNEVDDVDASGIENNTCVDGGHCQVNLAKNVHYNVSVDKDRAQKIPTNGVPDYVNCQEKPDDKVVEESNEEDDVKVSVVKDNTSSNNGHGQVNPAKDILSSVPVNKDRGHQIPVNQDSDSNKQGSDVTVNEKMSDDSISSHEASEENCSVPGKNKKHQCKLCLLVFSRNASLKRHMKRQHPDEKVQYTGTCHCRHCDFKCHKISDLRQHLSDKHGVAFTTTTVHLDNIAGEIETPTCK